MQLRGYQQTAVDDLFQFFLDGHPGNPVIAMPTGTGKGPIQAAICDIVLTAWPEQRILMLVPSKELIKQNVDKIRRTNIKLKVGICSASMNSYQTTKAITVGTIGTVIGRFGEDAETDFHVPPHVDIVLVDECHLISDDESTQYRKLFEALRQRNPKLRIIGLSATPYRMKVGHIIDGGLFDAVCHDATTRDAFNSFIDEGYLVPLIPRATQTKLDTDGVKLQSGEFQLKDLQAHVNKCEITTAAIQETLKLANDRNHVLIFSTGIAHAEEIADTLRANGHPTVCIHSKSKTRDEDLASFIKGSVRFCVNYGVLTTGFDMPNLDCIVMLRPTRSPGLWVQMCGRGTRPVYAPGFDLDTREGRLMAITASGKRNCLVLDFAENTMRLGPINDPVLPQRRRAGAGGTPPAKCCGANAAGEPNLVNNQKGQKGIGCGCYNHVSARHCIDCGEEFYFSVKFMETASNQDLLAGPFVKPLVIEHRVTDVAYVRHIKPGRPDSIRITYRCGLRKFNHYILPEHGGYARERSRIWWEKHGGVIPMPATTTECLALLNTLARPASIRVWENKSGHPDVMDWILEKEAA